mmetsp:Transcript_25861/g.46648  ORF Transcript_25861/g.46648 Transcript_25861/m.46648 type:complete len:240 (-) Transcript_25861:837-1556(-)
MQRLIEGEGVSYAGRVDFRIALRVGGGEVDGEGHGIGRLCDFIPFWRCIRRRFLWIAVASRHGQTGRNTTLLLRGTQNNRIGNIVQPRPPPIPIRLHQPRIAPQEHQYQILLLGLQSRDLVLPRQNVDELHGLLPGGAHPDGFVAVYRMYFFRVGVCLYRVGSLLLLFFGLRLGLVIVMVIVGVHLITMPMGRPSRIDIAQLCLERSHLAASVHDDSHYEYSIAIGGAKDGFHRFECSV